MTAAMATTIDERLLDTGDESGTAPGDRRFRPDVEGLRAVAVLLVVLYHAGVPFLSGGYVGVDVFFVISGFVITGLLMREEQSSGKTSILGFYARRVRRILPAATLVIIVTVIFSYMLLGTVFGNATADDGRWAAVFLSNFHFASVGTDYLAASNPPSSLQNYWSLSVEEQFYIVYPSVFLILAKIGGRRSFRSRMTFALGIVIGASFLLSIIQTGHSPTTAFFSPFTRAWELALGALVAIATTRLTALPRNLAAAMTWVGLAAILVAAFAFTAGTAYPGWLVAVPVVGSALIIAGGVALPRFGAESLLGVRPFQWLGRRSYSWYLWHWPILIIATEWAGRTSLPLDKSLPLVLMALGVAAATYAVVENPIRHWQRPSRQTVLAGAGLVLVTVLVLSLVIGRESGGPRATQTRADPDTQSVIRQVATAGSITTVPASVNPSVAGAPHDWGGNLEPKDCIASEPQAQAPICTLGDPTGKRLMVVYGDSHSAMWLPATDFIAKHAGWRLVTFTKPYCPPELVTVVNPQAWSGNRGAYEACTQWHQWVVQWINRNRPDMLIVTQESRYFSPSGHRRTRAFSFGSWQLGMEALLNAVKVPGIRKVVLGNTPYMSQSIPACLSLHPNAVQSCSSLSRTAVRSGYNGAEQAAASASGASYVDPTPWFCSHVCTPIIGRNIVYLDKGHITATYAQKLELVLGSALGFHGRT